MLRLFSGHFQLSALRCGLFFVCLVMYEERCLNGWQCLVSCNGVLVAVIAGLLPALAGQPHIGNGGLPLPWQVDVASLLDCGFFVA